MIWDLYSYHGSVVRGWIYNPFELALCRTGQDFLGHQDFKNHGLIKKGKIRSPILFCQFAQVGQVLKIKLFYQIFFLQCQY